MITFNIKVKWNDGTYETYICYYHDEVVKYIDELDMYQVNEMTITNYFNLKHKDTLNLFTYMKDTPYYTYDSSSSELRNVR